MFTLPAERCMVILYDFITLPAGCMIFLGDLKRIDAHWQPAFHLLFFVHSSAVASLSFSARLSGFQDSTDVEGKRICQEPLGFAQKMTSDSGFSVLGIAGCCESC